MTEISNERLAEMIAGLDGVTPGPWSVWREPTFTMADAIRELTFQVENTPVEDFAKAVYLLDAGGKCPATTGCGPSSAANASHIARCDPDTMRSILTELQSLRNAQSEAVAWGKPKHPDAVEPFFIPDEDRVHDWQKAVFTTPLYAHPAPQSEAVAVKALGEPDAWMWRHPKHTGGDWMQCSPLSKRNTRGAEYAPFHATSALTHPAPPLAVTDEIVERFLQHYLGKDRLEISAFQGVDEIGPARAALTAALEAKPPVKVSDTPFGHEYGEGMKLTDLVAALEAKQ